MCISTQYWDNIAKKYENPFTPLTETECKTITHLLQTIPYQISQLQFEENSRCVTFFYSKQLCPDKTMLQNHDTMKQLIQDFGDRFRYCAQ